MKLDEMKCYITITVTKQINDIWPIGYFFHSSSVYVVNIIYKQIDTRVYKK